jgi:hypothetical protein
MSWSHGQSIKNRGLTLLCEVVSEKGYAIPLQARVRPSNQSPRRLAQPTVCDATPGSQFGHCGLMTSKSDESEHRHDVTVWAAQKIAERRNGGVFTVDEVPDESERKEPAIDLIGHDSVGAICLEHTRIEAYEHQTLDNLRASGVKAELEGRFKMGLEPPGRYTLALDTGGLARLRKRDVQGTVDGLDAWIRVQALPVPTLPPLREPCHVNAKPPVVPVSASLYRMRCSSEDDGTFVVVFQRDADVAETRRLLRIRKALVEKTPKLEGARREGSTTALVLEMNDYVLSNPTLVQAAIYESALSVGTPIPDVITIVETSAGDGSWMNYEVKSGAGGDSRRCVSTPREAPMTRVAMLGAANPCSPEG